MKLLFHFAIRFLQSSVKKAKLSKNDIIDDWKINTILDIYKLKKKNEKFHNYNRRISNTNALKKYVIKMSIENKKKKGKRRNWKT